MVMEFVKGVFGKSKKEYYPLSKEDLDKIKKIVERRVTEQEMERIKRTMITDAAKNKDTNTWTVDVTYEEHRVNSEGESEKASIGSKSIGMNLDTAISDAWFTISTIIAPFGGDLFLQKESKEK